MYKTRLGSMKSIRKSTRGSQYRNIPTPPGLIAAVKGAKEVLFQWAWLWVALHCKTPKALPTGTAL